MNQINELPQGWDIKRIGDFLSFDYGKGLRKDKRDEDGVYPVYGSNGIVGYHSEFLVDRPCLIVGRKGTAGAVHVSNKPCWPIDTTYFILPPENTNLDYLYYLLSSLQLETLDKSTAIPGLNRNDAYEVEVPLPPKHVQDRIVNKIEELFTQLDAGVAELKEAKTRLERYRQSVLKAAVTGELTREWREAHQDELEPAEKLLERILEERRQKWEEDEWAKVILKAQKKAAQAMRKAAGLPYYIRDLDPEDWEKIEEDEYQQYLPKDESWKSEFSIEDKIDRSVLPEIPSRWIWTFFEQISDGTKNALKAGPFESSLKKEFYTKSGYKIFGQEQVIGQNPYIGDYYIDQEKYNELESCSVKPGDILISLVGTIGKVLILPDDIEPGIINPRLVKLSLNNQFVVNEYIKLYLYSHSAKEYFQLSSHGGTMDILNLTILRGLPIPLPNKTEQIRIVQKAERRLSISNEIEEELVKEFRRADRLRQSILKTAFEGKLV